MLGGTIERFKVQSGLSRDITTSETVRTAVVSIELDVFEHF